MKDVIVNSDIIEMLVQLRQMDTKVDKLTEKYDGDVTAEIYGDFREGINAAMDALGDLLKLTTLDTLCKVA